MEIVSFQIYIYKRGGQKIGDVFVSSTPNHQLLEDRKVWSKFKR